MFGLYRPKDLRQDLLAALAEFAGTTMFLLLGLGGIQATATSVNAASSGSSNLSKISSTEELLYISLSMGFALLVSAWIFYRVSGSAFNPNVATALVLVGVLTFQRYLLYVLAHFLGAIAASAILLGLLPGQLTVTTTLSANTNIAQGKTSPDLCLGRSKSQQIFIEMFITAALCLAVLLLAAEKHRATHIAPVGIGLTLFVCHLWAVIFTGAAMNTARAFGPCVVTYFPSTHYVYWVGDGLGSLLATGIYAFLKYIKYWELNPGQDEPDEKGNPPMPTGETDPRAQKDKLQNHNQSKQSLRFASNLSLA